eukprot:56652_1
MAEAVWFLFTESCWDTFLSLDLLAFMEQGCATFALSKLLSVGIILGAMLYKVPQIIKITSSQSAEGISVLALSIQTLSCVITTSYSYRSLFPFSTYGELPIVFIQNIIILVLIYYYQQTDTKKFTAMQIVFCVVLQTVCLNENVISFSILELLYSLQFLTIVGSVLPQIYQIYMEQTTGQLSLITTLLSSLGTFGRLFTTMQELDDPKAIFMSSLSATMRAILLGQFVIYRQ